LALSWLVAEVSGTLFPVFGIPDWGIRFLVIVFALGFVPALIISWVYEITPEGLKREKDVVRDASITHLTAKRLDVFTIGLIVVALGFILADRLWLSPRHLEQIAAPADVVTDTVQTPEPESHYPPNSIAVLPFVNMSDDAGNEYFSDGISEELLNLLAKIPELRVISRSSAFSFKGRDFDIPTIAAQLNVAHILEGSVRKAGNQVRITAQLIDASSDTHLWSETYDRTLDDIFAIQDEISAAIVAALKERLGLEFEAAPRVIAAASIEAYELYLRGNSFFNRGLGDPSIVKASELYQKSVEVDPTFILSHVGLAKAHSRIVFQGIDRTQKQKDRARESIEAALRLDEKLSAVLAAQGWYYYWVLGDYGRALKWFELALAESPNDSELLLGLGLAERRLAHWDDALKHLLLSFNLDPLSNEKAIEVGISYEYKHDFDQAVTHFQTAIILAPDQFRSYAHLAEGLIGRDESLEGALQARRKGGDVIGHSEFIRRMLSPQPSWQAQMLLLDALPEEFERLDLEFLTRNQTIYYLVLSAEQYRREGRAGSERAAAETLIRLVGDELDLFDRWVGLAYAHLGRREDAVRLLATAPENFNIDARLYQSNVLLEAYAQLLLGNSDAALERIDHALSIPGATSLASVLVSPLWSDLRKHVDLQLLLTKYEH
jgi:adenylate cyclase